MNELKKHKPMFLYFCFVVLLAWLRNRGHISPYQVQVVVFAMINSIVTMGLNLINGFTGQFSIGQAGFVAVGGYTSATITTLLLPLGKMSPFIQPWIFFVSVLAGGLVAGTFGYLIGKPSLRLKGDYLAIVTLAFGEVIRSLIRILPFTGGPRGFSGITRFTNLFWVAIFFAAMVLFMRNFVFSTFGRACISCREDELAAETLGINTTYYKVLAFTIGAAMAGIAGGLLAHFLGYLHPDQFSYARSTEFLVYLYAGGNGSITGSIIGATLLTIIPEVLRFLKGWRLVIYGLALVLMMIFRPTGLCGGKEAKFLIPKDDVNIKGGRTLDGKPTTA